MNLLRAMRHPDMILNIAIILVFVCASIGDSRAELAIPSVIVAGLITALGVGAVFYLRPKSHDDSVHDDPVLKRIRTRINYLLGYALLIVALSMNLTLAEWPNSRWYLLIGWIIAFPTVVLLIEISKLIRKPSNDK